MKIKIPNEVRKYVNTQTQRQKQIQKWKKTIFQLSKKQLEDNETSAIGFWGNNYRVVGEDFYDDKLYSHIKVLPVMNQFKDKEGEIVRRTGFYVAFNVNSIELNSVIELKVPKEQVPLFIGKAGWQPKEWCEKLGLKKIVVKGI